MKDIDIIILAGGLGKRLREVTRGGQKVMAEVAGRPFLEILIDFIARQGPRRFILATGYQAEEVETKIQKAFPALEIVISREEEPLGTGGAIKQAAARVKSPEFIAMNGDCFCLIDYAKLVETHRARGAKATIAVCVVDKTGDYGGITLGEKDAITAFKEKLVSAEPAFVNTGTYCFARDVFDLAQTPAKFSIEYDFFPKILGKGFYAYRTEGQFIDIGTPERYEMAQEFVRRAGRSPEAGRRC